MKALLHGIGMVIKTALIIVLLFVVIIFGIIFLNLRNYHKTDRSNYHTAFNLEEGFHEEYHGPDMKQTLYETIEDESILIENILTETIN